VVVVVVVYASSSCWEFSVCGARPSLENQYQTALISWPPRFSVIRTRELTVRSLPGRLSYSFIAQARAVPRGSGKTSDVQAREK
jgi:hypothetical protein